MCKFTFWMAISALILGAFGDPPQKISNGGRTWQNEFPYQISLRSPENHFLCSGAIISSEHILTAAHCIEGKDLDNMLVVTGTNSLSSGGVFHTIKKGVKHHKYRGAPEDIALQYDIAILTLSAPLSVNDPNWKFIKLASRDYGPGWAATVSGWGQQNENDEFQETNLMKIHTSLAELQECQKYSFVKFYDKQICSLPINGKTICPGDSGGPLVVNKEIVGIASTYISCGDSPSFFTKVYAFRDFIQRETGIYY